MSVGIAVNTCGGLCNSLGASVYNAVDVAGRFIVSFAGDLSDVKNVITHLKSFDATVSVWNAFAGREITNTEDKTRSTLKSLKGWNAVGTMTAELQKLVDKTKVAFNEITPRAVLDCVGAATGAFGKGYDIVSFMANELAISFFKEIADRSKTASMQALAVGSLIRGFFSAEKVVVYLKGSMEKKVVAESEEVKSEAKKAAYQELCDLIGCVGYVSLSISTLGGFGSKCAVASSALAAYSSSVKYFIGKF